jgi:hypothetical protein
MLGETCSGTNLSTFETRLTRRPRGADSVVIKVGMIGDAQIGKTSLMRVPSCLLALSWFLYTDVLKQDLV